MKKTIALLVALIFTVSVFFVPAALGATNSNSSGSTSKPISSSGDTTSPGLVTTKNTSTQTYRNDGTKVGGLAASWGNSNDHPVDDSGNSKTGFTWDSSVKKDNGDGTYTITNVYTGYYKPSGSSGSSGSSSSSSSSSSGGSSYTPPPPPPQGYLSIQSISPTTYARYSPSTAQVVVKNTGDASKTGTVTFTAPGLTQKKTITLAVGASTTLSFTFLSPKTGPFTLSASVDNSKSAQCNVNGAPYTPPPDSNTGTVIIWTEEDNHDAAFVYTDDTGTHTVNYPTKNYTTYKATMTNTTTIDPSTLKSGYGFSTKVASEITVVRLEYGGEDPAWRGTANKLIPKPPTSAVVSVGWTVTNELGTQPKNIALQIAASSSTTAIFEPTPNPVSNLRNKLIYTDVALAGTASAPKSHSFTIKVTGGGITERSMPFKETLIRSITTNGDMYEDDFTGAH